MRSQVARLDQLHGLIAVFWRHGRYRASEDGVYKACVLLAIATPVRDTDLKEVVPHNALPQTCGIGDFLHLLRDDLGMVAIELDALERESPRRMGARREGAVLSGRTGQQHDEVVKFAIDAGTRSAFDFDN